MAETARERRERARRARRLANVPDNRDLVAARELDRTIDRYEPRLARAFRRVVAMIHDRSNLLRELTEAIESGNLDQAINLVAGSEALVEKGPGGSLSDGLRGSGVDPGEATFREEAIAAVTSGAEAGARQLGERVGRLVGSLDLTNPAARQYLDETLPTLIREIGEEQRRAVRSALLRGFDEGRPARLIAREVRESVGLTEAQSRAVGNFRRQLETGTLGNGKHPTTRRLSATERARAGRLFREAAEGTPASTSKINQLVERYRESLVNRRARNIARTEATRAHGVGQEAMWEQAQKEELLDPSVTRRRWLVTPDERLRAEHAAVPSMNPNGVGLNEPFDTPVGPVRGPRESGVASFDVNCRCTVVLDIDE